MDDCVDLVIVDGSGNYFCIVDICFDEWYVFWYCLVKFCDQIVDDDDWVVCIVQCQYGMVVDIIGFVSNEDSGFVSYLWVIILSVGKFLFVVVIVIMYVVGCFIMFLLLGRCRLMMFVVLVVKCM